MATYSYDAGTVIMESEGASVGAAQKPTLAPPPESAAPEPAPEPQPIEPPAEPAVTPSAGTPNEPAATAPESTPPAFTFDAPATEAPAAAAGADIPPITPPPTYSPPAPSTTPPVYPPVSPPPAQPDGAAAPSTEGTISILVPDNALVTINGYVTKSTGRVRRYVAQNLEPGMVYPFTIRVDVIRDGRIVTETKQVRLTGGVLEAVVFDFDKKSVGSLAKAW